MNFNYRDFFIHNDDLHIIKEELSIIDEMPRGSIKDALSTNAKAVWDAYKTGLSDEQTIAAKLKINVETVKKIITICLMKVTDDEITSQQIATELKMRYDTVLTVLTKGLGSDFEREKDTHFINDAVKIYDLHKDKKTPKEIVNLVNDEKKEYFEKINLDDVNLVLKIVDIAKNQMDAGGVVSANDIEREIDKKIHTNTILKLIRSLGIGKIRYLHKFTEEQDAFILFNYLQGIGPSTSAGLFNKKFSTESNKLDIQKASILNHIKMILKPKGETDISQYDISQYVLDLLDKYKIEYFQSVNIKNLDTKDLLTHYRPPQTVRGRDPLARKGGKVDPTRNISGNYGNLEPGIHQTINTGEIPASGQLGKKSGAPINPQGALSL